MEGGAVLRTPRRFLLDVVAPSLGSYLARLAIVGVFLAAYGIPATFHNIATVTASNSISNTVSATPGGVGVTQAMNSVALAGSTDAATATAYSISQQLVTSAWNVVFAVVMVSWVFGWSGGKALVESSYDDAKVKSREMKDRRKSKRDDRSGDAVGLRRGTVDAARRRSDRARRASRAGCGGSLSAPTTSSAGHSSSAGWRTNGKHCVPPRPPCEPTSSSKAATSPNCGQ